MQLSVTQVNEIKTYLSTIHYISQKAENSGLHFVNDVLMQSIAEIEGLLKHGQEEQITTHIMDSEFISVIQFVKLLANASPVIIEEFLEGVEAKDAQKH